MTEQEQRAVEALTSGKTGRAVAKELGMSPSWVSSVARKHNLWMRTGRGAHLDLDHTAFDVITPESAYWCGFLFADGCIGDYGGGAPRLILDLGEKDRGHVEKFRTFLKSTHAISKLTRKAGLIDGRPVGARSSYSFGVRSERLVKRLIALGMIMKKGPNRAPTAELEDSIDFWRGAIDGDGTVRIVEDHHGYNYRYASLILCGHIPLLEKYRAFLKRRGILSTLTDTTSGIFQVRLMGSDAFAATKLLYTNAAVALDRKLAAAQDVLAHAK